MCPPRPRLPARGGQRSPRPICFQHPLRRHRLLLGHRPVPAPPWERRSSCKERRAAASRESSRRVRCRRSAKTVVRPPRRADVGCSRRSSGVRPEPGRANGVHGSARGRSGREAPTFVPAVQTPACSVKNERRCADLDQHEARSDRQKPMRTSPEPPGRRRPVSPDPRETLMRMNSAGWQQEPPKEML